MKKDFWNKYETTPHVGINIEKYDPPEWNEKAKALKSKMFSNRDYVVVWYGKVVNASNRQNSTKKVVVIFAEFNSGFEVRLELPMSVIPNMPIGSIWRNYTSNRKILFPEYNTVIQDGKYQELNAYGLTKQLMQDFSEIKIKEFNEQQQLVKAEKLTNMAREKGLSYPISLIDYPVFNLQNDANTLLVIPANESHPNIVIHPLTFFNAHYGVSKEINRILLTYEWGNDNNANAMTVLKLLKLEKTNPNCPDAVFIPDKLVIADAPFLYHLREGLKNRAKGIREYDTLERVKKFNSRISSNFHDDAYTFIKVEPYHTQPVEMQIHGLTIDEDTVLCTEIIGISMPQGEKIYYDVEGSYNLNHTQQANTSTEQSVKFLYQDIISDEIILCDELVNNHTRTVLRQKPVTIGKLREIARNENLPFGQVANRGDRILLSEPIPEQFSVGEQVGNGGLVGYLQVVLGNEVISEQEIQPANSQRYAQYATLLEHAQEVKRLYPRYNIEINCYTYATGLQGEIIRPMLFQLVRSFPHTVYILRFKIKDKVYYFIDFQKIGNYSASGHVIYVDDEESFLTEENRLGLQMLVSQMARNLGRLSERYEDYFEENNVTYAQYNHVTNPNSNWVLRGLENANFRF